MQYLNKLYMNYITIAWLTDSSHHPIYAHTAKTCFVRQICVVEGEMAVISNPTHSHDSFYCTDLIVPTCRSIQPRVSKYIKPPKPNTV